MSERTWTGPQRDAITAKGGAVLVSAAAGSGKTAVLVERAVRLICDPEHPVDADRLLIVTFSRAAAAEMRQRMGARLAELIREAPANLHLQRQQALLAGARISTVDSFCLDLVRQNFQDLEISPDFAVIDQNELTVLMGDCVADSIGAFYDTDESGEMARLVELLSAGRDDRQLAETVLKIYEFSRSHPFPEEWLEETFQMYATGLPVEETVWGSTILRYARESLAYCVGLTRSALARMAGDDKMRQAYEPAYRSDLFQLEDCAALAGAGDWDGLVEALCSFSFERLGRLAGDDSLKRQVKTAREQVKDVVKELAGKYCNATGQAFREDLEDLRPKIELLFRLVEDFSRRLWEVKLEKRRLHFADLEHLAIRLLVRKAGDGYRPTEQAKRIAERFEYVLVDEYQDTNEVQDMLFTCVSREQQNLFMVGDVKQSIYSFRQAMPEIFVAKKEVFFPYSTGQYPARIALDRNFRSRREVTGAVNAVFGCLMSREYGDVAYEGEETLKCGAAYPDSDRAQPELLLMGMERYGGERDAAQLEAAAIAHQIREMTASGYRVEDRGETRPVTLRDFCILMRSPRNRAQTYVEELAKQGVAAIAENTGGFLSTREISAVVSLLRVLDNPLLDIELAAVLLSPLFDFTDDDIARIRLTARGVPFFTAMNRAAGEGNKKAAAFLEVFSRFRTAAAVLTADRLLLHIYEETDALAVFQAMEMGESRRANLLLLVEYSAAYHAMGYKQLGGFVGFLNRLADRDGDLAPASAIGEGADAVRVMSIHRSKGLEFPVVFLADTGKAFNKVDLRQNTLLHAKYGFACVRRDYETFRQYPTVPMQAIRLEAQRSILSEEMRILYVALTRAREKLILTGVVKGALGRKLSGLGSELQEGRVSSYQVGKGGSYLDWLLTVLLHHASGAPLREIAGLEESGLLPDDGNPWRISVLEPEDDGFLENNLSERKEQAPVPVDPILQRRLREAITWRYPYLPDTKIPTKLAVSAVAKGEMDVSHRFAARPKFLTDQKLTPTERGNAMHKFMQFANYEAAREDLDAEILRMERESFLSRTECRSLHRERLREFFFSELYRRIFASGEVRRELKFMAECGQDVLGEQIEGIGENKVVIQGVADCIFMEEDGAVIVDYKTDRVGSGELLRERYAKQLDLYRSVLSDSLGAPVKECLLYSFHLGKTIKI